MMISTKYLELDKLREQKLNLINALNSTNVPSNYKDDFQALLNLLDAIQDGAKDQLEIKNVFEPESLTDED
jgi:hypothetical protein